MGRKRLTDDERRVARNKYAKKRWADKKEYISKLNRASKYGITYEVLQSMLDRQAMCCRSCGDWIDGDWAVDHDHDTGKVRDILCRYCNTALGMLRDDPVRVQLLFEYIARHKDIDA